MKFFRFIAFCFLVGSSPAIGSNEEDSDEVGNFTSADEANFVVFQSPEEASKVEPLIENFEKRFGETPAMSIPEEQGDAFQGDMILTADQRQRMLDTSIVESRTGRLSEEYRWPKNKGGYTIVPYVIDKAITADKRSKISKAMRSIEKISCIRFKERKTQASYVYIRPHKSNCQSAVGRRQTGSQLLELGPGCFDVGTITHELIHTLGYTHMHNHANRDDFVIIHKDRVAPEKWHNFAPVNVREYGNFDTPYDFQSIMHYPRSSFAKNDLPRNTVTIEPLEKYKQYKFVVGTRDELSSGDIKRINNMYKCSVT